MKNSGQNQTYDKGDIYSERKKKKEIARPGTKEEEKWCLAYFSKYSKIVRMVA